MFPHRILPVPSTRKTNVSKKTKLNVKYDFRTAQDRQSKTERSLEADELLASDALDVEINKDLPSKVDVHVYPSIHSMMHNAYATIDSEFRQLSRISQGSGLDHYQSKHFTNMVNSYAKLMQLELDIRQSSDLEAQSDEQIQRLAEQAYKKLTGKKMPTVNKKNKNDG
tara:strand:+ start:2690 stop:3193 length:504 start_codon:yes stop_codon:yes gene_type:complete